MILCGTPETELQIDDKVVRAVRANSIKRNWIDPLAERRRRRASAAAIRGRSAVPLAAGERAPPGPTEIEIAVAATDLNFRDLMWMLSLLPDDMASNRVRLARRWALNALARSSALVLWSAICGSGIALRPSPQRRLQPMSRWLRIRSQNCPQR